MWLFVCNNKQNLYFYKTKKYKNCMIEHKNIFTELKRLGINPNQLPENMPEDLKEAIESVKKLHYDWDDEEDDTEEVREAKQKLKETVEATIGLVKNWLNSKEVAIPASKEKKIALFLEKLDDDADKDGLRVKGSNNFYVKPFNLVAIGLSNSENETGKIIFQNRVFTRGQYEKFWTCKKTI
jgi:hypothetical protein